MECHHEKVVRRDDGTWHCDYCEEEFFHLDLRPGKIQVMELAPTLRDQFAMAAMIADSLQGGVIAAAYIGQGKTLKDEYPDVASGAAEYYKTADAMLEARKK